MSGRVRDFKRTGTGRTAKPSDGAPTTCAAITSAWRWIGSMKRYALSSIDLIPDFIPVLGLLDDLILVPIGIALCIRLIPATVFADARKRAESAERRPANRVAGAAIVLIWLLGAWVCGMWLVEKLG